MKIGKKLKEKGYNIYILSNMSKATFEYFSKKNDKELSSLSFLYLRESYNIVNIGYYKF